MVIARSGVEMPLEPQDAGGSRRIWPLLEPATTGTAAFSFGDEEFDPGASTTLHTHEEDEVLFIYSGAGRATLGDRTQAVGPGTAIYVPRGVPHEVVNTGPGPMRMAWFFLPAGGRNEFYHPAAKNEQPREQQ